MIKIPLLGDSSRDLENAQRLEGIPGYLSKRSRSELTSPKGHKELPGKMFYVPDFEQKISGNYQDFF